MSAPSEKAKQIARELAARGEGVKKDKKGRHVAYLDSKGILTGGIGHRILATDPYKLGQVIPDTVVIAWFEHDIRGACRDFETRKFGPMSDARAGVILSLLFAMGLPTFLKFTDFDRAVRAGDWARAGDEIVHSKWGDEVGKTRDEELRKILKTNSLEGIIKI